MSFVIKIYHNSDDDVVMWILEFLWVIGQWVSAIFSISMMLSLVGGKATWHNWQNVWWNWRASRQRRVGCSRSGNEEDFLEEWAKEQVNEQAHYSCNGEEGKKI